MTPYDYMETSLQASSVMIKLAIAIQSKQHEKRNVFVIFCLCHNCSTVPTFYTDKHEILKKHETASVSSIISFTNIPKLQNNRKPVISSSHATTQDSLQSSLDRLTEILRLNNADRMRYAIVDTRVQPLQYCKLHKADQDKIDRSYGNLLYKGAKLWNSLSIGRKHAFSWPISNVDS